MKIRTIQFENNNIHLTKTTFCFLSKTGTKPCETDIISYKIEKPKIKWMTQAEYTGFESDLTPDLGFSDKKSDKKSHNAITMQGGWVAKAKRFILVIFKTIEPPFSSLSGT